VNFPSGVGGGIAAAKACIFEILSQGNISSGNYFGSFGGKQNVQLN